MLFSLTLWFDFLAISLSLWLAFYLLARGFPSRITLRAVIVLLALSGFFLDAFYNIFHQVSGSASVRAVLLVIVLAGWYSLTLQLLPERVQKKQRLVSAAVYAAAVLTSISLLATRSAFVAEQGNALWVAHMGVSLPFMLYGAFQLFASGAILFNLLCGPKIGLSIQGRFFLIASSLPICAVGYGVIALVIPTAVPRLVQDGLVFSGVFLLGYSVARYQTLVERRTTLQDFPISALALLGLSGLYALGAWYLGYNPEIVAIVMALAITTHSVYDLVHENLERQRYRNESIFRKQLRQLESLENTPDSLAKSLQEGLELLCQTIDAGRGWVAVRQAECYQVAASFHSLAPGSRIPLEAATGEDVFQPKDPMLADMAWIAPASAAETKVAILAVSPPKTRLSYSADDLDLLAEVADRVGTIISLDNLRPDRREQISQLVSEAQVNASSLRSNTAALMDTLVNHPDPDFIGTLEDALRHLADSIALGQSPLAAWSGVAGANHIERGRNLQQLLIQSIEALRPSSPRPPEPLPREWYNYVVMHDAYVECVPNREIMARLYISEGTFNRTRRNALRGLARLLLEKK